MPVALGCVRGGESLRRGRFCRNRPPDAKSARGCTPAGTEFVEKTLGRAHDRTGTVFRMAWSGPIHSVSVVRDTGRVGEPRHTVFTVAGRVVRAEGSQLRHHPVLRHTPAGARRDARAQMRF